MSAGLLYLVPVAVGDSNPNAILPAEVQCIARNLRYFVVENAKSARIELKRIGISHPVQEIDIRELPRQPSQADLDALLAPLAAGQSAGLMSEAGAPAVADPGALLVHAAHVKGIRVIPLVGPSSLLLGLMASGLNGQCSPFTATCRCVNRSAASASSNWKGQSHRELRTQIFIETPYRNAALFAALLETCRPDTRLCVATELTTSRESMQRNGLMPGVPALPPYWRKDRRYSCC